MNNLAFFSLIGALFFMLSSCSNSGNAPQIETQNSSNKVVISSDLENANMQVPGWGNEGTVIAMTDPAAHSGKFACKTSKDFEYTYYFSEKFKNIKDKLPVSVSYHGWVYSTVAKPNFAILCTVKNDTNNLQWSAYPLDQLISHENEWIEFTADFYFTQPLKPDYQFYLGGWNQSKQSVYLDDLTITLNY